MKRWLLVDYRDRQILEPIQKDSSWDALNYFGDKFQQMGMEVAFRQERFLNAEGKVQQNNHLYLMIDGNTSPFLRVIPG